MSTSRFICGALTIALLPLLTGCSGGPETVRGQSPSGPGVGQIGNHYFQPGHPYAQLAGHSKEKASSGCADGTCGSQGCSSCNGHGRHHNGHGHHAGRPYGNPYANGGYPPGPYAGAPYPGMGGPMMNGGQSNMGNMWHPTHYHTFTYNPPQNLVYPQQNQPAAVVQYPYYTHKGPDDFFLK